MTLRRENWEQIANNYVDMGKGHWAERIRQALVQAPPKRVNVTIDLAALVPDFSWSQEAASRRPNPVDPIKGYVGSIRGYW